MYSIVKILVDKVKIVNVFLWLMFLWLFNEVVGILIIDISDVIVVKKINKKNINVIIDVFM